MSKPNTNRKKYYDAYKSQGRREKNKARKAAQLEKKLAKFAARKENAEYLNNREDRKKARDPRDREKPVVEAERIGGWDSIMGKISYVQDKEEREAKKLAAKVAAKKNS
jgi:hypothetical protein